MYFDIPLMTSAGMTIEKYPQMFLDTKYETSVLSGPQMTLGTTRSKVRTPCVLLLSPGPQPSVRFVTSHFELGAIFGKVANMTPKITLAKLPLPWLISQ